jgi:hypothetical protein
MESSRLSRFSPVFPQATTSYDVSAATGNPAGQAALAATVTAESGKQRVQYVDGLGRLIEVVEDPNGADYSTKYVYDGLGNIHTVRCARISGPCASSPTSVPAFTGQNIPVPDVVGWPATQLANASPSAGRRTQRQSRRNTPCRALYRSLGGELSAAGLPASRDNRYRQIFREGWLMLCPETLFLTTCLTSVIGLLTTEHGLAGLLTRRQGCGAPVHASAHTLSRVDLPSQGK